VPFFSSTSSTDKTVPANSKKMERAKWLVFLLPAALVYGAKPIPKSAEEISKDISMRPWLGSFEGCLIWNPECVRFSHNHSLQGYFMDSVDDSATNESRCLQRASEYHGWCGNSMTNRTAAVFLESAAMEVYPPYGCSLFQRGCPQVVGTEFEGVFFDDYDDAFMNETRCLQRALDFRVYCHPADSPETVAAYYAPTAKHFTVNLLHEGAVEENVSSEESDQRLKLNKPIEVDVGNVDGHSIVLNSTVRALWTVSRSPPSFSATAVPLALFDLAGEYLDCHSPPMPLVDGRDKARASRYHCNGPEAELAVEALTLFISVHSQHADAHYNLGVAYYTLTNLDSAVSCFVEALKINPHHSMSVGALGTILTQQGKFEEAWKLLDGRVRPSIYDEDNELRHLVKDEGTGDDGVNEIPRSVSPSVVMAWARLAPRFQAANSAVVLLKRFMDRFHRETDPEYVIRARQDDDEESNRHAAVVEPSLETETASKLSNNISPSLRSRLEANLAFRLAQLLSQAKDYKSSWKETMRANHLSTNAMMLEHVDLYGDKTKCALGSVQECKNLMSSTLALKQMAALRMAFCRECVHYHIPAAQKWRTVRTTAASNYQPQDIRPIFVVGMPRSGTTLIEQMLGNHPQVMI
jgi:tetratricopeptide (TPR) repeat protein